MDSKQAINLLQALEQLLPIGIGLYKELQATIDDHGTKSFEDILVHTDANFSHVLKNMEAEKAATSAVLPTGSVPDATGTSTPPAPLPQLKPTGSQGSPGSGTAVPPKTA